MNFISAINDIGTQLERVTVSPGFLMSTHHDRAQGTLEAETINPESEEKKECRVEVEDKTRVRMTE